MSAPSKLPELWGFRLGSPADHSTGFDLVSEETTKP